MDPLVQERLNRNYLPLKKFNNPYGAQQLVQYVFRGTA